MISWIRGGNETALDDRENITLLSHDGLGMPDFHRMEERGPLQHGVTDRGYRLDPKTIVLVLGIRGNSLDDFYQKRHGLLDLFKPSNKPGSLRWKIGSKVRQIDGHLIGGLNFSDRDRSHLFQKAAIAIKCPDPTWYDPAGRSVEFSIGGGGDTMDIPLTIPFTVGASMIDTSQSINYQGSVLAYPVINIRGPITDCVIKNLTTGDKLDFTGHTIPSETTYTVDLRYGHKTVLDDAGNNRIDKLTDDSDLATWRLEADPVAMGGSNSIYVYGTDVTSLTGINLQFYERYIGV